MSLNYQFDNIDLKILELLTSDAKRPYTEVAKKVNVSPGTVHVRMNKMEEFGVLDKTTLRINYNKIGYDITKKINAGLEYYGALGEIGNFDPLHEQQQQIVPSIDLNLGENWEFNFGVGVGVTAGTDHLLVKMILGRRFGLKAHTP